MCVAQHVRCLMSNYDYWQCVCVWVCGIQPMWGNPATDHTIRNWTNIRTCSLMRVLVCRNDTFRARVARFDITMRITIPDLPVEFKCNMPLSNENRNNAHNLYNVISSEGWTWNVRKVELRVRQQSISGVYIPRLWLFHKKTIPDVRSIDFKCDYNIHKKW